MKISAKIVLILLVCIVGSLSVFAYFETKRQATVMFADEEDKIRSLVVSSLGALSGNIYNFDLDTVETSFRVLMLVDSIDSVMLYNASGAFSKGLAKQGGQLVNLSERAALTDKAGFVEAYSDDPRQLVAPSEELGRDRRQVKATIWFSGEGKTVVVGRMIVGYRVGAIIAAIEQTRLNFILSSLLLAVMICLITFFLLRAQIVVKILRLYDASIKIAAGDYVQLPSARGSDETAKLTNAFNQMSTALKAYAERMEQLVESKTRNIRYLLDLMPVGILSIERDIKIGEQFSARTPSILDQMEIAGTKFSDLLAKSNLSSDKQAQISAALDCSIGVMDLSFQANEPQLVTEMEYAGTLGKQKIIEMTWTPVVNDEAIVEKVLVTLVDATDQRLRIEHDRKKNAYLKVVDELLNLGESKFRNFVKTFNFYETTARRILETRSELSSADLENLFIQLHTMKGNARACDLTLLAVEVHDAEQELVQYREEPAAAPLKALLARLGRIVQELSLYEVTARSKLNYQLDSEAKQLKVDTAELQKALEQDGAIDSALGRLMRSLLNKDRGATLVELLDTSISSIPNIAKRAGKLTPQFIVKGERDILLKKNVIDWIQGPFNHLITNSIDHGVETPEERQRKDKPERPVIEVSLSRRDDGGLQLDYRDDGRGIHLPTVRKKLASRGLSPVGMSHDELVNAITLDGFSTTEQATQLSGRGVGVGAVLQILRAQACELRVVCCEVDADEFAKISFVIDMPSSHLVSAKPRDL